jgi:O-antigen ligase
VALSTLALNGSSAIESFFTRGESLQQLSTLNSRTDLWAYAFELFPQHPLYGFGLTASPGLFLDSIGLGGGHNAAVNLLIDNGVLGALVWMTLLVTILVTATRLSRTRPGLHVDRGTVLS